MQSAPKQLLIVIVLVWILQLGRLLYGELNYRGISDLDDHH